jgi:hypothetical protein
MIKSFFYLQFFVSAFTAILILFLVGHVEAISFSAGALFAFMNTLFLTIIVSRIFAKKSVALSFILIIFKYLVFGLALYFLITNHYIKVAWFVVGLSLLVLSVIGLTVLHFQQMKKERQNNGTL